MYDVSKNNLKQIVIPIGTAKWVEKQQRNIDEI